MVDERERKKTKTENENDWDKNILKGVDPASLYYWKKTTKGQEVMGGEEKKHVGLIYIYIYIYII